MVQKQYFSIKIIKLKKRGDWIGTTHRPPPSLLERLEAGHLQRPIGGRGWVMYLFISILVYNFA